MSTEHRARIWAFIGASGSGKGVSIKRALNAERPRRLLIWDPRDEYGAFAARHQAHGPLAAAVQAAGQGGPFAARFVPRGELAESFEFVCRLAFLAGHCTFLAEELSDVTKPAWAPPAWRRITTQGRHRALHVIGAAQRPALIDKTFLANCTRVQCGALQYDADCQTMARELRCDPALIAGLESLELPGGARMTMLRRDRNARTFERVELTIRGGRTTEKVRPMP